MNPNSKPQAINLGQPIDDESSKRNDTPDGRPITRNYSSKSLPLNAADADNGKKIHDYRDQLQRRKDAALRLPPLRCGCRDPLFCRCQKGGRR